LQALHEPGEYLDCLVEAIRGGQGPLNIKLLVGSQPRPALTQLRELHRLDVAEALFAIAGGERIEPRPDFPGSVYCTTVPYSPPLDHFMHKLFIQEGIAKVRVLIVIDRIQTSNDRNPEGFAKVVLNQGVKPTFFGVALDNVADEPRGGSSVLEE
jgi:hypothetical protein